MNTISDPQFQTNEAAEFARSAMRSIPVANRSGVVNRTHRVIRERARVMQEKRTRNRSLMVPMIVCSVLLILSAIAVWSGLYQYEATEAAGMVQADVATLAAAETTNHFMLVMLWFAPVLIAVITTVWVRRSRNTADDEAR
jgi:hypothetical protein